MKIKTWLWSILATSVVLRVIASIMLGNEVLPLPAIFDQISYHFLAIRVIEGHGFTFGSEWWPMTRAGEPTAHWSFLYTLYLVAVYSIFGVNPLIARIIQAVIVGLAGPWLAFRLASVVFAGRDLENRSEKAVTVVAMLAAGWFAIYGYFIYYAAALMTESFFIVCILWSLDCASRIVKLGNLRNYLELGLAAGMAVLFRQTYFVFIPVLLVWLVWAYRRLNSDRQPVISLVWGSLAAIVILVLMVAPFTYMNYRRFGHFVLLNTNAGFAFFWSNHPVQGDKFVPLYTDAMPSYQEVIPLELRSLDEAALDKALMKLGFQFILDDPLRYALLTLSRISAHFLFWPLPGSSLPSNLTRVLSIGLALPFMIAGGWLWFRDVQRKSIFLEYGLLLVLFMCIYIGLHLLSWASVRYRLPTDAVGLVFAARALQQLFARLHVPLERLVRD